MSEIRKLSDAEFEDYIQIYGHAYPAMGSLTKEKLEKYKQKFIKTQNEYPSINTYGLFREEKLLGVMILYDLIMNVRSVKMLVGGIGSIAVNLLNKKEKVAKEIMLYSIRHYRELGASLTALYPFRPDFYKKMGYGYGTKMNQYQLKPLSFPKSGSKKHLRFLSENDRQEIVNCYNRYFEKTHGMCQKMDFELDQIFNNPANKIVGYQNGQQIQGYMVFYFKRDREDNFLLNNIHIDEFVYETRDALFELMAFLYTQADQINDIIINTQDEYFHHVLFDPRDDSEHLIPSVYHESHTSGVGLMYRVSDVKRIFEVLGEQNFNGQTCKLKITVTDSFLQENRGSLIVHFKEGKPSITSEQDDFDVEIFLDVSDFSSLIMGSVNFKSLYRYGLAQISDLRYMHTVQQIFLTDEKPVCMTAF